MANKECKVEIIERVLGKEIEPSEGAQEKQLLHPSLDEEAVLREARRCLGNQRCESCDLCQLLCPDLALIRSEETGEIEIDLDACKRCGICALVCPKGAIKLVLEDES